MSDKQAISAKIAKLIRRFSGGPDTPSLEEFVGRVDMAKELFGENETVAALPFVLDEGAFDTFTSMTAESKKSLPAVIRRLRDVFGLNPQDAPMRIKNRQLGDSESLDVLLRDLRQQICALNFTNSDDEDILLKNMFVAALPSAMNIQIRALAKIDEKSVEEVLRMATALRSGTMETCAATTKTSFRPLQSTDFRPQPHQQQRQRQTMMTCIRCQGSGHTAQYCRAVIEDNRNCYACGKKGHIARNCNQKASGNELAESVAQTTSAEPALRQSRPSS